MTVTPPGGFPGPSSSSIFNATELVMKRKILSLREHYDIEDASGNLLAVGDGNFLQLPAVFRVKDPRTDLDIMTIEGKVFSLSHRFTFRDNLGVELGVIRKRIGRIIGNEFWIERDGTELMRIYGDFLELNYSMGSGGREVARAHRDWFSLRDRYGITVLGDVDRRLLIGAAIVIDHVERVTAAAASS
jgi:uncharacterized protein YxjI